MMIRTLLGSTRTAIVVMTFVVALGLVFGHRYAGWLGVAFVGLVGLVISFRAEMFEDYIDPTERTNGHSVQMHARYLETRAEEGLDRAPAHTATDRGRDIMHRAINAVLGSIALAGLGLHLLHE